MAEWWEGDPVAQQMYPQAVDWWKDDPEVAKPDVAVDMAKGAGFGFNEGLDATLNLIGAPVRAPVNYIADKLGYGEVIPELNAARRFNVAGPAQTTAGRTAQAVGEVAGGTVIPTAGLLSAGRAAGVAAPGIIGQYASAPTAAAGLDAAAAGGAGLGVAAARENELGPIAEMAAGLVGGVAVPNAVNIAARTAGGVRAGVNYANRMIDRARNPETAAYRDVADQGVKAGFNFDDALNTVSPPASPNLTQRGFTQDDMAEIISRQLNGEHADDVVRDYAHLVDGRGRALTGATARQYLNRYQEANTTPMNVVDLAKEQLGSGGAVPLANQARADMAIADDPMAAQRLISRQREQPGRTADAIEQSGVQGRNLDEQIQHLSTTARNEEDAAYRAVRQQAQPIDIGGVINNARRVASTRGGEIGDKLNEAINLFYRPVLGEKPQSPMGGLRLVEAQERLQDAVQRGASETTINRLRRRLRVMREQDDFSRPLRENRLGEPINDVGRFIDARDELSQMTRRSMQDGEPTPLTRELTRLRQELNAAARQTNRGLEAADARFSENRSAEAILQRGQELGKKLTPQTRQALREFRNLTPTQQELMRVSFEGKMAAEALGTKRGNAAADQFNSEAFDRIIAALYPQAAGRAIYQRGQTLLHRLRREAISTETTRDALSGSRTAALQDDMAELMEGPRAAADLATGRWGRLLENISNRLTRQIGQRAASERIRILTDTDPANRLVILRRLRDEATSAAERRTLDLAISNFAAVGRRRAAEVGTIASQNDQ